MSAATASAPPQQHVLSDQHRRQLEEGSAIASDVIADRGYYTAATWQDLPPGEFKGTQKRSDYFPALVVPQYDREGDYTYSAFRPDVTPVKRNGQAMKYIQPSGRGLRLDVPKRARVALQDGSEALWWTEGAKKADALVSAGVTAVSTPGVEGWRGPSAIPDLFGLPFKSREVICAYDSDVLQKTAVFQAVRSLAAWMRQKGAEVFVVDWEQAGLPVGSKVGADDYLAGGHTIDDLTRLAVPFDEWLAATAARKTSTDLYVVDHGHICVRKREKSGDTLVPLCNFDAWIAEQVVVDDGVEERCELVIDGTRDDGRPLGRRNVPLDRFASMSWVVSAWGTGAILVAGQAAKDHLRAAIQVRSGDAPIRRVFAQTGWHRIDGEWRYLTNGTAIGATDTRTDIDVSLPPSLAYALPEPPSGDELRWAVKASLFVLDVAPLTVTAPMMGATYLAPLRECLDAEVPDLVPWLVGGSGAFKSELAALCQSHYGHFPRVKLPANFRATANAIERLSHTAKDTLLIVDDYYPSSDIREASAMAQVAGRLLRDTGNQSGRPRMKADTSLRAELRPRCLCVATGERLPDGHSTEARMFPVMVAKGAIRQDRLTAAQDEAPRSPLAMAGYVQYVARHMDELRETLPRRFRELRSKATTEGGHTRGPAQVAHLYLARLCPFSRQKEGGRVAYDSHPTGKKR